ncbi:hypothetical protein EJ110_NYTH10364 [Nymphaea thermarum]|nr:hypothetical protein EJ110_NYTH10364 [Nymphaea thermarum]
METLILSQIHCAWQGRVLVRFAHAKDMCLALRQQAWRLAGKTFVVNRWTPSLDLEVESTFKIPVWNDSGGETASGACRRTATPCVDAERHSNSLLLTD